MDELSALFKDRDNGQDLLDRLSVLLDRQTDHKLAPTMLLGYLGMFNLLSIMNFLQGSPEKNFKEIKEMPESVSKDESGVSKQVTDALTGLLSAQGTGGAQGAGQPDLLGMLGSLASKKKINPTLLLSLFSMLNQAGGNTSSATDNQEKGQEAKGDSGVGNKAESTDKRGSEFKFNSKKG